MVLLNLLEPATEAVLEAAESLAHLEYMTIPRLLRALASCRTSLRTQEIRALVGLDRSYSQVFRY